MPRRFTVVAADERRGRTALAGVGAPRIGEHSECLDVPGASTLTRGGGGISNVSEQATADEAHAGALSLLAMRPGRLPARRESNAPWQ